MSKRKTEEDYYKLAKSRDFMWLGVILPKNTNIKTLWKCDNGHKFKSRYSSVLQGHGCPYCSNTALKTEKDYCLLAKKRGFIWIGSSLPSTVRKKTYWFCDKGHIFKSAYMNVYNGNGCSYCSNHVRLVKKDYHKLAESKKIKWVGKSLPKTTKVKTKWKCSNNHEFMAAYTNIKSGWGCPYCSGKVRKVEKDYYNLAKEKGIRWLGYFPETTHSDTLWGCSNNHKFKSTYNRIQQGCGCPHCKNFVNGKLVSKPQIKLNNLLYGILNYPEERYRIDIVIMRNSQKIAVEYDCQYWHRGKEEHDAKRDKFLISRGWKVLHVKSGILLPSRKQMKQTINKLLKDEKVVNLYLNDWI